MGLFITTGERNIKANCSKIADILRALEPKLYSDLSFESDHINEQEHYMPFGYVE